MDSPINHGTVSITLNDTPYTANVSGGIATIEIPDLDPGIYEGTVTYEGGKGYDSPSIDVKFKVMGLTDIQIIEVTNATYPEDINITVAVTSNGKPVNNGIIIIRRENRTSTGAVQDGIGIIQIPELDVGLYEETIIYTEGNIYHNSSIDVAFKVTGIIDLEIIEWGDADYPDTSKIKVKVNCNDGKTLNTGNISIEINGKKYIANVTNGIATIEIPDLSAGTYEGTIRYDGGSKYSNPSKDITFYVKPIEVKLDITQLNDINQHEMLKIKVNVSGNDMPINTGKISIRVNERTRTAKVENGTATIEISGSTLYMGIYTSEIKFDAGENYTHKSQEVTFQVFGVGNITVKHTDAGDTADIQTAINTANPGDVVQLGNYSYHDVANVNITKNLTIYGDNKASISSSGKLSTIFNIPAISKGGPENVTIKGVDFKLANGDIVVKATADNDTNPLSIITPNISITGNTFELVNETTVPEFITILELDSERGILSPTGEISISGNTITAGIDPFEFEVTNIETSGDINIGPQNLSDERKATVIVYENMNTTAVSPADGGKTGEYFTWRLTDADGNPIANTPMEIGFNGVVYTYEKDGIITDEDGYAKLQINLGYKGVYTFAICFLGDYEYNASFVVAKITVDTQKPTLTVPNKSYAASAKTKTLTATFKSEKGNPIADKWITFTVNGKTYKGKTDANGLAKVNVSLNTKGTYSIVAKFAGDSTYTAISKTAKLTIN